MGQAITRCDWRVPLMKIRNNIVNTSQTNRDQFEFSQDNLALRGMRVLLAEDNQDFGRICLSFLRSAGAEVTLECNGQSAVDAVRDSPRIFDVILMDFMMPELDGIDATRQLRELGYRGAILAMTAYGTEQIEQEWFEAGCNEFIRKPIRKHHLIRTILDHMPTSVRNY